MSRTDSKTVSIPALAAFHPNTKVQSAALHFFLGSENDDEDESDNSDDEIRAARKGIKSLEHRLKVTKGGRKKDRMMRQSEKDIHKVCADGHDSRSELIGRNEKQRLSVSAIQ